MVTGRLRSTKNGWNTLTGIWSAPSRPSLVTALAESRHVVIESASGIVTERVTRITGENAYIKIDYAAKKGQVIRRTANLAQMQEVREQLRKGADLTDLKWQELVNIENLVVEEAEPILMEIKAFLDAVRAGTQPEIDATAGFVNVRTAERIVEATRRDWTSWKPSVQVVSGIGVPGLSGVKVGG